MGKGLASLILDEKFQQVRATEVNDEVSERARPARHIHPDGVVRYYDRKEAAGARIVRQVDKGRLAGREVYIMHENIIENREVNSFY